MRFVKENKDASFIVGLSGLWPGHGSQNCASKVEYCQMPEASNVYRKLAQGRCSTPSRGRVYSFNLFSINMQTLQVLKEEIYIE